MILLVIGDISFVIDIVFGIVCGFVIGAVVVGVVLVDAAVIGLWVMIFFIVLLMDFVFVLIII